MRFTFTPPGAVRAVHQGGKSLPIANGAVVLDPADGKLVFYNAAPVTVSVEDLERRQ